MFELLPYIVLYHYMEIKIIGAVYCGVGAKLEMCALPCVHYIEVTHTVNGIRPILPL